MHTDPKSLAGRPKERSRLLGQVFTPQSIADHIVARLMSGRSQSAASVLDPCVGPGVFPQAMMNMGVLHDGDTLTAVDVDTSMIGAFRESFDSDSHGLILDLHTGDYLTSTLSQAYDYAVLNPPYVRQEWLDDKSMNQALFQDRYGLTVPGTSNLYVYFIVKAVMDLKPGGKFACIVYDSWQSTNYGRWLLNALKRLCATLEFEVAPDQPFFGRLIDATILYGCRRSDTSYNARIAPQESEGETNGQSLFAGISGFRQVNDLFHTRRGLRLKQADFFLCDLSDCIQLGATPFIKKIGRVRGYQVPDTHPEAALLIREDQDNLPTRNELNRRLQLAMQSPARNESILTWYRERPESWNIHRAAPFAPLLFNYYLRNRPRHVYNPTRAYSDNFYGLNPRGKVSSLAWLAALNSTAVCAEILSHARNQGTSLAKVQLFEYRRTWIPDLDACEVKDKKSFHDLGEDLAENPHHELDILNRIDDLVAAVFSDERLRPQLLSTALLEADRKARRPKEVAHGMVDVR